MNNFGRRFPVAYSAESLLLQIEVYDALLSGSIEQLEHDEVEINMSPIPFGSGLSERLLNIDYWIRRN